MKELEDLRRIKDKIDGIASKMQKIYQKIDEIDVALDGVASIKDNNLLEQTESEINELFLNTHKLNRELDRLYKKYIRTSIQIAEVLYEG